MMKMLEDLRERLCELLDEESKKKEVSTQWLDNIHHLTDSIKNIDKIVMLESGEIDDHIHGYEKGSSYAHRGKHYVRGHYSHDTYYDDYPTRGRRSYSHDSGYIAEHLRAMMEDADDKQRDAIKRCLKEMGE